MFSKLNLYRSLSTTSWLFFLLLFSFFQINHVEAGGWGKKKEVVKFEGENWNEIYFKMNGIHFSGFIPNYLHTTLNNNGVSFDGHVGDEFAYVITTSLQPGFESPRSVKKFIENVKEANPDCSVDQVETKKKGVKYIIDVIRTDEGKKTFWRYFCTKSRLIKMGTTDLNEKRKNHFFESLAILKED